MSVRPLCFSRTLWGPDPCRAPPERALLAPRVRRGASHPRVCHYAGRAQTPRGAVATPPGYRHPPATATQPRRRPVACSGGSHCPSWRRRRLAVSQSARVTAPPTHPGDRRRVAARDWRVAQPGCHLRRGGRPFRVGLYFTPPNPGRVGVSRPITPDHALITPLLGV